MTRQTVNGDVVARLVPGTSAGGTQSWDLEANSSENEPERQALGHAWWRNQVKPTALALHHPPAPRTASPSHHPAPVLQSAGAKTY